MADEYRTTREVAELFRTAESTVRYWRHIGYGPRGIRIGRRVLYPVEEIAEFERKLAEEQHAEAS